MEEIPDKNIFMMCRALNRDALTHLGPEYHVRTCREEELGLWKAMHFDDPETAREFGPYMDQFFETTYAAKRDLFFSTVLFVCTAEDQPVATCFIWKAYGLFNTIHWFKVIKEFEGRGIGRALLSLVMQDLGPEAYPVYLHTQPGSYRAIKLYSDFGFELLDNPQIGARKNELAESLPILKQYMPPKDYQHLRITQAPAIFIDKLKGESTNQF